MTACCLLIELSIVNYDTEMLDFQEDSRAHTRDSKDSGSASRCSMLSRASRGRAITVAASEKR